MTDDSGVANATRANAPFESQAFQRLAKLIPPRRGAKPSPDPFSLPGALSSGASSSGQAGAFLFGLFFDGRLRQRLFVLAALFAALQITVAVFAHLFEHEARAASRAGLRHRLVPD